MNIHSTTNHEPHSSIEFMFTSGIRRMVLALSLLGVGIVSSSAAISVIAPTASTTGSFTITQDITFTITTGLSQGQRVFFNLDNWVSSDAGETAPAFSPNLSVSINGGTPVAYLSGRFGDNYIGTFADITAGDGYFYIDNGPALPVNTTVTLKAAAAYTIAAASNFNPQGTQTFSGNMFLSTDTGAKISNTVSVPEPASLVLFGLAIPALLGLRLRKV